MSSPVAAFDRWLHQPAPAERLAALRIAIGGFVTLYVVANVREFDRLADRNPLQFRPVGAARLLDAPLSPSLLWLLFAGLLAAGVAFTVGLLTRFSAPAFAILTLIWASYHSSWGRLLHFEHLFTIHLLILAFAPTGDAWAVRAKPPPTAPSVRYGWPVKLLAMATAATYALAGIAKLRHTGFGWFETDTLANHIGYSATRMETLGGPRPPLAAFVLSNRWLIAPMAIGALAVELGAPLALLGRRLRNLWVLAALVFHAGTAATMLVFFGYRGLGVALLPLFAVERAVHRFTDWRRARSAVA